jgi:hypothetical protein
MPYRLDWEPRGLVLHFSGRISGKDPEQATIEYERDIRFDDLLYVIADYSQIEGCHAMPADIDEVLLRDTGAKYSNPNIRKAVVTTSPEVIAMANRYKKEGEVVFPVKVFPKMKEARDWIGTGEPRTVSGNSRKQS